MISLIHPISRIVGFFDFRKPTYIIRDPELIRKIAIKDFDSFEDHKYFLGDSAGELFGNSLFMMKGAKWRDMRATLSPAFTGSKMRQMFEFTQKCADDLIATIFQKRDAKKEIRYEMKDLFSKYTNDVIASCAFGCRINSLDNPKNDFYLAGQKFLNITAGFGVIKLFCLITMQPVMKLLDIEFLPKSVSKFFKSMALDTMNARAEQKIFRPDMINLLMNVRKGVAGGEETKDNVSEESSEIGDGNGRHLWSDGEIAAQCFLFFIAGYNTTSTSLMFTAYELALNQHVQTRLYEEIVETETELNGKPIDYNRILQLKYLDQVISESLRKWPPGMLAFTDRVCAKDYSLEIDDKLVTIEKGHALWFPIFSFHRDARFFPDPEVFDPDRFSDENKGNIINGTYIPFGAGPRNCIGRFSDGMNKSQQNQTIIYS